MFVQEVLQQLLQIMAQPLASFQEMQDLIFQLLVQPVIIAQLVLHTQFLALKELIKPQQASLLAYHALLENIETKQESQRLLK